MNGENNSRKELRTGWISRLARISMALLLFEAASGLALTFSPFHAAVQWSVIIHTLVGVAMLLPLAWYSARHWLDYRRHAPSHVMLLGYVGLMALGLCAFSGVVVTWQGVWSIRTSPLWRMMHLITTFVTLATLLPHVLFSLLRAWREGRGGACLQILRGHFRGQRGGPARDRRSRAFVSRGALPE